MIYDSNYFNIIKFSTSTCANGLLFSSHIALCFCYGYQMSYIVYNEQCEYLYISIPLISPVKHTKSITQAGELEITVGHWPFSDQYCHFG